MLSLIVKLIDQIDYHLSSPNQQDILKESFLGLDLSPNDAYHIIVPIDDLNTLSVKALRYARSITPRVTAFHVEAYEGESDQLKQKWELTHTKIPLVIRFSPDHHIIDLLTDFIDSEESFSAPGDVIAILVPQLVASNRWETALHNNTRLFLSDTMLKKRNVRVLIIPFYLDDIKGNKS